MKIKVKCVCGNLKQIKSQSCRVCSYKRLSKLRENENNPNWVGTKIGKNAVHDWVRRRKTKPKWCSFCKKEPPRDLANISQKYKIDVSDFVWICRRCHMLSDGRLNRLLRQAAIRSKKMKWMKRRCKVCNAWIVLKRKYQDFCSVSCAAKRRWENPIYRKKGIKHLKSISIHSWE